MHALALATFTFAFLEEPNPNFSTDYILIVAQVSPLAWITRTENNASDPGIGRRHFLPEVYRSIATDTNEGEKKMTRMKNTTYEKHQIPQRVTLLCTISLFLSFFLSFFFYLSCNDNTKTLGQVINTKRCATEILRNSEGLQGCIVTSCAGK